MACDARTASLRVSPTTPDAITITISGSNDIELNNVLVGDVWVCSGQSNMKWEVQSTWDADLEIPLADYPQIRLLTIETPGSQETIETCDAAWEPCTPKSVRRFSAVGYYFGQMLHRRIGVPIGLIDNAWGGSSCEAWTPRERLEGDPIYAALLERWRKTEATYDAPAEEAKHREAMKSWRTADKAARAAGHPRPARPRWENPLTGKHRPGNLFHGRLGPILPFGIRGVIWYQGESNASRAAQYGRCSR